MIQLLKAFFVFLALNFAGLAMGGFFTGPGVQSEWYAALPQAPWTPPGWVFGAAWTAVMVGFSFFMAGAWTHEAHAENRRVWMRLFAASWVLNVGWNPVFFTWHQPGFALVVIVTLAALVSRLALRAHRLRASWRWGIAPYLIWLAVATSLNAYSALA